MRTQTGTMLIVRDESRRCFEQGPTSLEASRRIDFGPCGAWRAPALIHLNVERDCREMCKEPEEKAWNSAKRFDLI
jgi:cyclase